MIYTKLEDLRELFPPGSIQGLDSSGNASAPCPFCDPGHGQRRSHNGHDFVGDDRLVLYRDFAGAWCRVEGAYYTIEELVELLDPEGVAIEGVKPETKERTVKEPTALTVGFDYVENCHQAVVRSYWYRNGWDDTTINHFLLGYGTLYPHSNYRDRHLIPFRARTKGFIEDRWSFEGRIPKEVDAGEEPRNSKTGGLKMGYFWHIDEGDGDTLCITEGPKDAISMWQIGYRQVIAIFGSSFWSGSIAEYIQERGFKRILCLADNDEAGRKLNETIAKSLGDLEVLFLQWPDETKTGQDLTDLLAEGRLREYIDTYVLRKVSRGYIPDYEAVDPDYEPEITSGRPLKELREEMPVVLREFLDGYKQRRKEYGRPAAKLLSVAPGTGKSYALVQIAQEEARKGRDKYDRQQAELETYIAGLRAQLEVEEDDREAIEALLERAERKLERLPRRTVLYVGPFVSGWYDLHQQPGFDSSLWFNLEGRNRDNCENLEVVNALAGRGYLARAFCDTSCPFAARCREQGYLRQEEDRRKVEITFGRHSHLRVKSIYNDYRLVIIDENPLSGFDEPFVVDPTDLRPVREDWGDFAEPEQVEFLEELILGVRAAMNENMTGEETLSGRLLMDVIDKRMNGRLVEILEALDEEVLYDFQPEYATAVDNAEQVRELPHRSVPTLIELLRSELADYLSDTSLYNSRVHLVRGKLHLYPLETIPIIKSHPVIISDATALPELYETWLDREIEVYNEPLDPGGSEVIVLRGSDFTRQSIRNQMGTALRSVRDWEERDVVEDVLGVPYDLSNLPVGESDYGSTIMSNALELVKYVAREEENFVLVTYKNFRVLLERQIRQAYPEIYDRMAFGHYGSLRGLNVFKEYQAALLIGVPRIPYDAVHRQVQAWARLASYPHYIPNEVGIFPAPYHGTWEGYNHPTFTDPFARRFLDMIEVGEIEQALHRVRLYTSGTPKRAYLALNRPGVRNVTDVRSMHRLVKGQQEDTHRALREYIHSYYAEHKKYPTYRATAKMFQVSNSVIKQIREGSV